MIFKNTKNDFTNLVNIITNISDSGNDIEKIVDAVKDLSDNEAKLILTNNHLDKSLIDTVLSQKTSKVATEQDTVAKIANATIVDKLKIKYQALAASLGLSTAALTAFIGVVAGLGIAAIVIEKVHISAEETKEAVSKLKAEFDSAIKTANQNLKTFEGLADRYEELSDGVSDLGHNLSLSTEEFEEYNNIVNQIADMSPELVKGYTAEGNAILSLKDNVDELKQSYIEAQKEAYNLLISSGKDADGNDIIKQWKDLKDTDFLAKLFDLGASDVGGDISTTDAIEQLEALQDMSAETYRNIKNASLDRSISAIEKEIGYGSYIYKELGIDGSVTDKEFAEAKRKAKSLVQTYKASINSALSDVKLLSNAYLMTNDDYSKMSDEAKNIASVLTNSITAEMANGFESQDEIGSYVDNIVQILTGLSNEDGAKEAKKALIDLFSLNKEDVPVAELKNQIDEYISAIAPLLNEESSELKARLGFDDIDDIYRRGQNSLVFIGGDKTTDEYNRLSEYTKDFNYIQWETWLNVTNNTMSATSAIIAYNKAFEEVVDKVKESSITDTVNNINNKLKPALDSLTGIYITLFDKENGYEWQPINVEEFASIKEQLDSLSKDFGVNVPTEDYEKFVKVLSDTATTEEQAQQAFDDLATSMINNSNVVELTDENFDVLRNSLENLGITNAKEVLEEMRDIQKELADAGIDLKNVTLEEAEEFINLSYATGITKEYLRSYLLEKYHSNKNPINTLEDVKELEKECKALNVTGQYLKTVLKLKTLYEAAKYGGIGSELQDEIKAAKAELDDLYNNQYKYEVDFDFDGNETGKNKDKSSAKDTAKTFDWIETLISRIQRNITNLGKLVSATYRNWSTRNNALAQEMAEVNKEINAQMTAYNAYMEKANSIPLAEGYKALVRSGAYDISTITDEKLQEQISEYEEWYNKALDASDAIEDLRANLAELAMTKFNNVSEQYDEQISLITHNVSMLEGFVSQSEAAGYMASEVYYKAMAEKQQENIAQLQGEYSSLLSAFDEAVKNGSIQKYSSDWYEMLSTINDVELELQDATTQLVEFNQTLQQLSWEVFDRVRDSVSDIVNEGIFLTELLSLRDLHTDKGVITDEGLAVQGLHAVNYNTYMEQSLAYAEEMRKIEAEMAKDPYDMELVDRRNELLGLQQEAIQNAMSEKEAIRDLISDGYDKMLNSLDELINKRKEALQAEKDMYDYQNSISEKTSNIASLKKQLQAYSGDNSESAKATIQKLQVSLSEAEKDLQQTEYEKYLSDQEQMLDTLYNETEQWVNQRLDDIDGLISEAVDATNKNAETISNTIKETANSYGYGISDQMETIWDSANDVVRTYGDILKGTNENIANNITTGTTNVVTAINGLNGSMQTMIGKLNEIATANANSIAKAQNAVTSGQNGSYGGNHSASDYTVSGGSNTEPTKKQPSTTTSGTKYAVVDRNMKLAMSQNLTYDKAVEMATKNPNLMIVEMSKIDKQGRLKYYASGTPNADKGWGIWGEKGKEILVANDGSILLSSGATLYPFQGGETVFNAKDTSEILNSSLTSLGINDFSKVSPNMNGIIRNTGGDVNQDINVNFSLPNVTDANSLINELQHDKRFEKIIQSMTADRMLGKNSLNKYKF